MKYIIAAAIEIQEVVAQGKDYSTCEDEIKTLTEYGFICQHRNGTRFVSQEEALSVAIAAGQRITLHNNLTKLSPEDINDDPLYLK